MVQSRISGKFSQADRPLDGNNALHDLGYKIFLDRYAQKDMTRATLTVGDTVIVVVDSATGQREVGKIAALKLPQVTIELLDGSEVTRDVEHVDKPMETTPEQMMDRVAAGIADVETSPETKAEWTANFRWLLDGWKFVPGGRILTGAGTDQNLTYYNCYVIPSPRDSREGIIKTLGEMTEIMSRGGGVGINISSLRPRHAYVKGVNGRSSGSVSWGALYSFVTGLIEQGGCFGPDERILTDQGLIPAAELADRMDAGEVFYAHTHKGLRQITARFRNGVKPLYEVTTSRGYSVRITLEHKVAVYSGADVVTIPLAELSAGDNILLLLSDGIGNETASYDEPAVFGGAQTAVMEQIAPSMVLEEDAIESIVPIGDSDVYDFEVEDVHLLCANGIYTSNSRRGALMLILNDWHPDVFDFINSKRKAGNITNANISVGVSDKLMAAIKTDGDWDLMFPDTSDPAYDEKWDGDLEKWIESGYKAIKYKTIKARELWNTIIESAWASAEPGVWFRERSNKMSNSWYYNLLISTNPCGEQPLSAYSVCNLGAINLSKFYDADAHDVAWDDLRDAVRYAVRFLDNVIDSTPYFFEENARVQGMERRVGLGTMGIAELMIRLQVRYGSPESEAFIDSLYKFIAIEAYTMSSEIAQEKGAFSAFDADKFLQSGFMVEMPEHVRELVRQNGMRNVTLLTQAPTGTTGTLVNTSTGIEPFFSWVYYRKSRLGLHEEKVPVVQEWYEANPGVTDLPDYFATAMDLTPEEHVRVQGSFQRWIDSAISKTCNLPNDYTVEQVGKLYEYMYELGCKGGTVYRDGSRDEQVLMLKGDERAEKEMERKTPKQEAPKDDKIERVATPHRVYPRPRKLTGITVNADTPFGTAYITMNSDEHGYPFEVFITAPGKAGSDLQADAEGLGRMVSLSLRTTDPHNRRTMLRLIIEQLRDIGGARSVGFGQNRVISLPDAVGRALEENFFAEDAPQQLGLPMTPQMMLAEPEATPKLNAGTANPSVNGNGNGAHSHASMSGADLCPSCANITLLRVEGCRKCLTCGYTEC